MTLAVAAHDRRRPTPGSEHPFDTGIVEARGGPEVGEHAQDPTALGHVAHQLRRPGVELVVVLFAEAGSVFTRVGGQTGRGHGVAWAVRGVRPSMPDRLAQPPGAAAAP